MSTVQIRKAGPKYTISTTLVNYKPSDDQDFLFDGLSDASQGSPNQTSFAVHPESNVLKKYQSKNAHRIEKVSVDAYISMSSEINISSR